MPIAWQVRLSKGGEDEKSSIIDDGNPSSF